MFMFYYLFKKFQLLIKNVFRVSTLWAVGAVQASVKKPKPILGVDNSSVLGNRSE